MKAIQLLILTLIHEAASTTYGLKWGEKCKIPGQNDFLKPSEECEMSKGLQCQQYQQGSLCGCPIRSSLSWDERAEECRRKPGHHCPYINSTSTSAYDHLPYNHKCHVTADCKEIEHIPEIDSTSDQKTNPTKKEHFAVCKCKPGYKETRDGLVCHSVNSSPKSATNILILASTILLLT